MADLGSTELPRRTVLAGLAASTLAPPAAAQCPVPAEYRALPKAVWAWRITATDLPALRDEALRQGIARVLLSLSKPLLGALVAGDRETVAALTALRGAGLELVALVGEAEWVHRPDAVSPAIAGILQLQARAPLFKAVQLDVEPHTLPDWHGAAQAEIAAAYLTFLDRIRRALGPLPLEATIHPSYAKIAVPGAPSLLASICTRIHEAGIMAYRNRPEAAVSFAAPAIDILEACGTPWRFGVLTHPSSADDLTYAGASFGAFSDAMVKFAHLFAARWPGGHGRGLVFEDYHGLTAITARCG
jgi:hypothetical protein